MVVVSSFQWYLFVSDKCGTGGGGGRGGAHISTDGVPSTSSEKGSASTGTPQQNGVAPAKTVATAAAAASGGRSTSTAVTGPQASEKPAASPVKPAPAPTKVGSISYSEALAGRTSQQQVNSLERGICVKLIFDLYVCVCINK